MKDKFGVNIALKHKDKKSLDKYVELIKELGAGFVRIEFDYYEYKNDAGNSLYYFDYLIDKLHKNNIKILGVLAGVVPGTLPNLIYSGFKFKNPLDEIDIYKDFTKNLVERYKDSINYWQIWNEENIRRFWTREAKPEEYFELVKTIVPEIKKINPDSSIVLGSICGDDVNFLFFGFKTQFLKRLIELGINDYVDVYSFHPYIASNYIGFANRDKIKERLLKRITTFLDTYKKYAKDKEIWITELGISKFTVLLENRKDEDIAQIYTDILDYTINKNNVRTFLWVLTDFKDKYYSPFNPEPHFGLVDYDFNRKITFNKVKDFIKDKYISETEI